MDVVIHHDGSADVQEIRQMRIGQEGTECFIKMYNWEDMDITRFSVREDSIVYHNEGRNWDVDRSRSEKAFRCGINEVIEGNELCWGVGSSGEHRYVVRYTIIGLVKSFSDYDGFNHNLYEAAIPAADYARITFRLDSDVQLSDTLVSDSLRRDSLCRDNAGIWAFGFWGDIRFEGGKVVAETDTPMNEGNKMIVMMRFPKGLFAPTLSYPNKSFEGDVRELAFIDSDYTIDDEGDGSAASRNGGDTTPMWQRILYIVLGAFCCCGAPLLLLIWAIFGRRIRRRRERKKLLRLLGDAPAYYEEPPLNGNLIRSRRILRAMEPSADNSEMKLVEAYVMRLVDRKAINIVQEMNARGAVESFFRIEDPEQTRERLGEMSEDTAILSQLLALLYTAAGNDHLLQPQELKRMVKQDPVTVRSFARRLRDLNGVLLHANQIHQTEAQQVYGFWKYLKDFTLVADRALQEVALWKEYLTFATLFGIADQVRADMKRLAPDLQVFDELTRHIISDTTANAALYTALTQSIIDAATRTIDYETDSERLARLARERAEQRERWSGGGGRSSFGGGGGFSGGGGSGVR